MDMRLRWFSNAEDRLDAWVTRQHRERVLEGRTAPAGPCPDEAFLEGIARHSKQIALSDPRVDHAGNCPICMRGLLELRSKYQLRRRTLVFTAAVGCCLLIVAAFVVVSWRTANTPHPVDNMAAIAETIDLWNAGTLRSLQSNPAQPSPLESVSLPRALAKVTIILPRFSPPGQYVVAVTQDQNGNGVVAQRSAPATSNVDHEVVSVELDLRAAKAGAYFLTTIHEQDQASYYYPLRIR